MVIIAKKLKKSWVEVQKIKSQWKAQKRREGIVSKRPRKGQDEYDASRSAVDSTEGSSDGDENDDAIQTTRRSSSSVKHGQGSLDRENPRRISTNEPHEKQGEVGGSTPTSHRSSQREDLPETSSQSAEPGPSLRELNNTAYSRASLHHFKSHNRNRIQTGRGQSRGGGDGTRSHRGKGRGQPDMRLRMNAVLEKIKRDMT